MPKAIKEFAAGASECGLGEEGVWADCIFLLRPVINFYEHFCGPTLRLPSCVKLKPYTHA